MVQSALGHLRFGSIISIDEWEAVILGWNLGFALQRSSEVGFREPCHSVRVGLAERVRHLPEHRIGQLRAREADCHFLDRLSYRSNQS